MNYQDALAEMREALIHKTNLPSVEQVDKWIAVIESDMQHLMECLNKGTK